MKSKAIIQIHSGKPMVSSLTIAKEFDRPHFRVLKAIDGLVERGKLTTGVVVSDWIDTTGRSNKLYLLNERSALIAMPFIGGAKAEEGQVRLVDAYLSFRGRKQEMDWMEARELGKQARLAETDTVKEFVEYATSQGSKSAKMYYMNITKGTYSALFTLEHGGKWEGIRDCLSKLQLTTLASAEQIALKALREAMEMNMHYKDGYKYAIGKVKGFADLIGTTKIPDEAPLKLVKVS